MHSMHCQVHSSEVCTLLAFILFCSWKREWSRRMDQMPSSLHRESFIKRTRRTNGESRRGKQQFCRDFAQSDTFFVADQKNGQIATEALIQTGYFCRTFPDQVWSRDHNFRSFEQQVGFKHRSCWVCRHRFSVGSISPPIRFWKTFSTARFRLCFVLRFCGLFPSDSVYRSPWNTKAALAQCVEQPWAFQATCTSPLDAWRFCRLMAV